jgi:hypothetical protein
MVSHGDADAHERGLHRHASSRLRKSRFSTISS